MNLSEKQKMLTAQLCVVGNSTRVRRARQEIPPSA